MCGKAKGGENLQGTSTKGPVIKESVNIPLEHPVLRISRQFQFHRLPAGQCSYHQLHEVIVGAGLKSA